MKLSALSDAIDSYHDLLTPELAQASASWFEARLAERGLRFGSRPLCTVIRPRFLTRDQYARIQDAGAAIAQAFNRPHEAAVEDPAVRAQFHLADWEESWMEDLKELRVPAAAWPSPLSRYDAFFDQDEKGLKFTENNAETPAGSEYGDVLGELFLGMSAMGAFLRRYDVRFLPSRPSVLDTLLASWRIARRTYDLPVIGIIDWNDVPTQSEFRAFKAWFESLGLQCVIADPRDLELRDGRLTVTGGEGAGTAIDLIYKRVLLHELVEREGIATPMLQAVRTGAAVMVNPLECKVLHKKASLAVLSDERNSGLFDADTKAAIDRYIPWTRVVEDRATVWHGKRIGLLDVAQREQQRFVLKPNDDYGGAGIVLGWEVDAAEWSKALQAALAVPTVLQERIFQPSEPYPSIQDGQLDISDRIVDTAPYAFQGSYVNGVLSRISTATLVNVTAGGGSTVPTFIVEAR